MSIIDLEKIDKCNTKTISRDKNTNNESTKTNALTNGLKQGCGLSPTLFTTLCIYIHLYI